MLSQVQRTLRAHDLVAPGDRVLLGVSGGPDSTAMLHVFLKLAARPDIAIEAACVDHGLRPEAADEAQAVAERCRERGIRCEVLRPDVRAVRKQAQHVSWQDAARRARLSALE